MFAPWSRATVFGAVLLTGLLAISGRGIFVLRRQPASDPQRSSGPIPLSLPGGVEDASRHEGVADESADVAAQAAVVIEGSTGKVLFERHAYERRPIASLAKLMSAMVVLDRGVDLDANATIFPSEYTLRGGNLRLRAGEQVAVRDLLYASITGSANNAAFALPRVLGISETEFVREMNRKAVAIGLENVQFVDPAGFSPENVGTAYDVARMAAAAFSQYPLIADAARTPEYRVGVRGTGGVQTAAREHVIRNSNRLLSDLGPDVESKTGYLDEARYCLALAQQRNGERLVAVLLGHPSEFGVIRDAAALLDSASLRPAGTSSAGAVR